MLGIQESLVQLLPWQSVLVIQIKNTFHLIVKLIMCNLENGLITNNRLILLDSYLVFFTAFSICAYTTFYKQRSVRFHHTRFFYHQKIDMWVHYRAFSRSWWIWLLLTGVGLGCAFSSKWVGIFTMATVGVSTLKHLWEILGDVRVTKVTKKKRTFGIMQPMSNFGGFMYNSVNT